MVQKMTHVLTKSYRFVIVKKIINMKTKLLTICLLLFTSQVFADEVSMKCSDRQSNVDDSYGSFSYYKYSESFFGLFKKIKYREDLKWKDWCTNEWLEGSRFESIEFEKSAYGGKCTQIGGREKWIFYIDFIQSTRKVKIIDITDGETHDFNFECSFIDKR